jgi:hypothetical protein
MAKYDIEEAHRVWKEQLSSKSPEEIMQDVDAQLVDMLGFFLWNRLNEKGRTKEMKQKVIFASLMAAYIAGRRSLDEEQVASAFFDFVETLDIKPTVDGFEDLGNWD